MNKDLIYKLIYFSIIFQLLFNLVVGVIIFSMDSEVGELWEVVFKNGVYKTIQEAGHGQRF